MLYSDKNLEVIYLNQISLDEYHILIDQILLNFNFEECYEMIKKANINLDVWTSVEKLVKLASNLLFDVVEKNHSTISCGVFKVMRFSRSVELLFIPYQYASYHYKK